jgi:hypothetical protein
MTSKYNCPACDAKISLKADTCPHCGESLESFVVRSNTAGENVKDIGLMILSLSIFALLGVAVTKSNTAVFVFFGLVFVGLIVFIIGRFMNMLA